jgi:hypothetical protein
MKRVLVVGTLALSIFAAQAADIVDTAIAAGSFTTLVSAIKAADLVNTLKGVGRTFESCWADQILKFNASSGWLIVFYWLRSCPAWLALGRP